MIQKIKYVLFDFSEDFKNNFMALFKKTAALLVIGLIVCCLGSINETLSMIGGGCLVVFGFLWGRDFVGTFFNLASSFNNFFFKMFAFIFTIAIALLVGFVYFLWCVVKVIVYYIKRSANSKKNKSKTK